MSPAPSVDLLRHSLATLAYRARKAITGAPAEFPAFKASPTTRTPAQILAHIGDLMDWGLAEADGRHEWHDSEPLPWDQESARFYAALTAFDARLSSSEPLAYPAEKLFQGPVADALTHVGQISLLRRMAGSPVKGENYFRAKITSGTVGLDQPAPVYEFD
jgi:hypothetical protein